MAPDFETSNIFASRTALACTSNPESVLADSNVRSNRHPPAMQRLQPWQCGNRPVLRERDLMAASLPYPRAIAAVEPTARTRVHESVSGPPLPPFAAIGRLATRHELLFPIPLDQPRIAWRGARHGWGHENTRWWYAPYGSAYLRERRCGQSVRRPTQQDPLGSSSDVRTSGAMQHGIPARYRR